MYIIDPLTLPRHMLKLSEVKILFQLKFLLNKLSTKCLNLPQIDDYFSNTSLISQIIRNQIIIFYVYMHGNFHNFNLHYGNQIENYIKN